MTVEDFFTHMLNLFEDGKKWRKGGRKSPEDSPTFCMVDAFVESTPLFSPQLRSHAYHELSKRIGHGSLVFFNDRDETTFADIKRVLT